MTIDIDKLKDELRRLKNELTEAKVSSFYERRAQSKKDSLEYKPIQVIPTYEVMQDINIEDSEIYFNAA